MSLQVQLESPIRRVQDSDVRSGILSNADDSAGNRLVGSLIQAPTGYIADDNRTSVMATSRDVSRNLTGSLYRPDISMHHDVKHVDKP